MKFLKGICLFFLFSFLSFFVGCFSGYYYSLSICDNENYESSFITTNNNKEKELTAVPVVEVDETLCADTIFILEEKDLLKDTVVETTWKLPEKYIGMNRERFLQSMDVYQNSPPLDEKQKGFVNLEVKSFSRNRVVILKNYLYVQPTDSFYLAVCNNEVVVYLEDMTTIYINTGLELDTFPEDIQKDIINTMEIEDEKTLYDFLESYTS